MQGLSKKYPYVDSFTIREHFFKKLPGKNKLTRFDWESFDAILAKAEYSGRNIEGVPGGGHFCRGTFIEIVVRMAHHFFSALVVDRDKKDNEFQKVPLSRSFGTFLEQKLSQYFVDQGLNRSSFKEEQLWDREVDMVFSINQKSIKQIFS